MRRLPLSVLMVSALLLPGCHGRTSMNHVSTCGSQVTVTTTSHSNDDALLMAPLLVLWLLISLANG